MIRHLLLLVLSLTLAAAAVAQQRPSVVVAAENVNWLPFEEALEVAQETNKKILIDVYAPWCGFCRRMHLETYSDPEVSAYLADNFVVTRVDGDNAEDSYGFRDAKLTGSELGYHLGARGFPTTVFLFSDSKYLTPLPGFVEPTNFIHVLRYLATDAFEDETFEEFTRRVKK